MKDEISIRELVEILLRGKKLVAIITVIAMLLSGVLSFVMVVPSYEATAVLLTNPINGSERNIDSNIEGTIDSLVQYPNMTVDTYREQFINPTVLNSTIDALKLSDKKGNLISQGNLTTKISIQTVEGTNLLKVKVNDIDPAKAALIANTLSEKFIEFITNNSKELGEQATSVIEEQMKKAEDELQTQAIALQDYHKNSPDIDQMKLDITTLNNQITNYKKSLNDTEKQISSDYETLQVLTKGENLVSNIDLEDIKINIPMSSEASNGQGLQMNITNNNQLQSSLLTIKITEIETRLVSNVSEQRALKAKISEIENSVEDLQSTLAEAEYQYNAIQRNYDLAEQTYNAYLDRHKEAVIKAASDIGKSVIIVSSKAIEPIIPVGHGKMFFIAIGTILGLILGVCVVLFIEYWKLSGKKVRNNTP